jgi:hypothetical protein
MEDLFLIALFRAKRPKSNFTRSQKAGANTANPGVHNPTQIELIRRLFGEQIILMIA